MERAAGDPSQPPIDGLWDYGNPADTEARFRALLPSAERASDASYHVQLLTQIARAQGLQRAFDAGHRTLDQTEPLLDAAGAVARVRYLLERGRLFNSAGEPERARPLFLAA